MAGSSHPALARHNVTDKPGRSKRENKQTNKQPDGQTDRQTNKHRTASAYTNKEPSSAQSLRPTTCGRGEPSPSANVAAASPVLVQMWQGEPSPGSNANVAEPRPVQEQCRRGWGGGEPRFSCTCLQRLGSGTRHTPPSGQYAHSRPSRPSWRHRSFMHLRWRGPLVLNAKPLSLPRADLCACMRGSIP
jgi:hypothetical protein